MARFALLRAGRQRPGRLPDQAMLGAVQLLLAAYCVCAAVLMPTRAPSWANLAGAVVLVLLAVVTWAVLPQAGTAAQNVVVACTSAMIAGLTAVRTTGQGQLVMGLFVLMLAMWCAAFLPTRSALAQVGFAVASYVVALVVRPHTGSAVYVIALLAGISFASAMVRQGRVARSRYRSLVGSSADVMLSTANGRVSWVSSTIADVLGWSPAEFIALPDPTWHADDDAIVQRMRRELYAGQPSAGTYRLRHRDGTYRWVEARLNPITGPDGAPGSVGSIREVTDRVIAEEALARSLSRHRHGMRHLRGVDAAKTRKFHEISHELRTPLTVIRGPLERHLRRDADLPDALRTDIETAVRAGRRLEALVNDILDVARADTTPSAAPVETDVATLTAEVVQLLHSNAAAAGLTTALHVDTAFPRGLVVDSDAWARIVLNLLSNAIKYTDSGGVRLDLGYDGAAKAIVLRVDDTGRGIADDDLHRVFDRFYTTGDVPPREAARTGLGLALVADAVLEAGGHIDVSSRLGLGSTFVVTLPAAGPGDDTAAQSSAAPADRAAAGDDDPVGDAIGLLMSRGGLSADQALTELKARAVGRPLAEAATEVLATEVRPAGQDGSPA